MDLISTIKLKAQKSLKHIVLPEGTEDRTLKAANQIIEEKLAKITLLGDLKTINKKAKEFGLKNIENAQIIDPKNHAKKKDYINLMVELRKDKGLTKEQATKLIEDPLYLGCLMIKNGDADGEVAGADNATSDVLRPAFQFIKTLPGISVVSGSFLMILKNKSFGDNGVMFFADCGVFPDPNEKQLAEIAISTAKTAKAIANIDPVVAMLSFSTKGSAKHPMVDKVANATKIAREMAPDLQIDGELQADAAIIESVAAKKAPGSKTAGRANVLIFPSLEAGNIGYKLVERLAGAEAIGPILQGLAAPINDLSRGCSVNDIVNLAAITSNQASEIKK